jgi:quercetin dioxygenase-like cupin family protein
MLGSMASFMQVSLRVRSHTTKTFEKGKTMAVKQQSSEKMMVVSTSSQTIAGEPLAYPATPEPEVTAAIFTMEPGTQSQWMVHPVQGFLYILEGTLTVEFADDGSRQSFEAGTAFLQTRTKWHRGRNDGDTTMRFLAVFTGAKHIPPVLHPPVGVALS